MLRGVQGLRSLERVFEGVSVSLVHLGCVGKGPGSRSHEGELCGALCTCGQFKLPETTQNQPPGSREQHEQAAWQFWWEGRAGDLVAACSAQARLQPVTPAQLVVVPASQTLMSAGNYKIASFERITTLLVDSFFKNYRKMVTC